MTKFIKFFIYSLIILITIWFFLAIFLSKVGLETTRFNHLINQQVKKYNDSLNLDIKKVKIYLNISSLTNPKIEVKSKNPTLTLGKNKIKLNSIKTEINIFASLVFLIIFFGIYPEPLFNTIDISVNNLIDNYQTDLNFHLVQVNN